MSKILQVTTICLLASLYCTALSGQSYTAPPVTYAERMPYFAGCETLTDDSQEKRICSNERIINYISKHLQYPEEAKTIELEGAVYAGFTVDEAGYVRDPYVIRDIGGGCGEEAIRVIQSMPKWEPALNNGIPVSVKLNLRILFNLSDNEEQSFDNKYKMTWGLLKGQQVSRQALIDNLQYPVAVRDEFGNPINVDELILMYEKNNKMKIIKSNGKLSAEQIKLIQKVRRGGLLTITGVIQEQGSFRTIERTFEIMD